jgi:ParB family transcriptional regulator, chromosome partitioning protein
MNNLVVNVPVEYILANPYQPRMSEDGEHIKKLALSIAMEGLMQIPAGRLVDADGQPVEVNQALHHAGVFDSVSEAWAYVFVTMGCRVQLAFGHSRLAAFKWLVDIKDHSDLVGSYDLMPVTLMTLSDEEMFRQGVRENVDRKDLSAIETAKAMLRFRDEFDKTSEEIGAVFGVSAETVRGKLRLLGLPEDVQAAALGGGISEGTMRELLFLYDLPEETRKIWDDKNMYSTIAKVTQSAIDGRPTAEITREIDQALPRVAENMGEQKWKNDEMFAGENIRGACQGCPFRFKRGNTFYCGDKLCFGAKTQQWKAGYLQQASLISGIPAEPDWSSYATTNFQWATGDAELRLAKSADCQNLRLVFGRDPAEYEKHTRVDGFPFAEIVCAKSAQFCTCKKAVEIKMKEARGDGGRTYTTKRDEQAEAAVAAIQGEAGSELDQDALRQIAQDDRRRKREELEAIKAFCQRGKVTLFKALLAKNPVVWKKVAREVLGYSSTEKLPAEATFDAVVYALSDWLGDKIYSTGVYEPSAERCVEAFDGLFAAAGVEKLVEEDDISSPPSAVNQGKSLVEVFEDGGGAALDEALRTRL